MDGRKSESDGDVGSSSKPEFERCSEEYLDRESVAEWTVDRSVVVVKYKESRSSRNKPVVIVFAKLHVTLNSACWSVMIIEFFGS